MEELQRQLHEARTGKALAMHAQVMQVRMGPEASGEDELNAYLLRLSCVAVFLEMGILSPLPGFFAETSFCCERRDFAQAHT